MKNLKLFTLLIFTGFYALAFSQKDKEITDLARANNVKVKKGTPYSVIDSHSKSYFVTDGKILSIKTIKGSKFIFQVFDQGKLNELSRKEEILKEPGFSNEATLRIGNRLFLFYSVYDKPNTTEQLFAREISLEKGGFIGSPRNILKISEKIKSFMGYDKFNFDISADESKLVVKYKYMPDSRLDSKNTDRVGMVVYDDNLDVLLKQDVNMPDVEAKIDNFDFTVDSKGNGYFLLKKYKEAVNPMNKKTARDPDNYTISILKVSVDGAVSESEFQLQNYLVQDMAFKENENNEIICAGYYRQPKVTSTKGVFVAKMNQNGEMSTPNLYDFSLDFIKQYRKVNDRAQKKLEKAEEEGAAGIHNLEITDIVMLNGGGILLAGNIYYITTRTDSKGNTYVINHWDDIILTKIDANGELNWMKKIPKRSTFESFKLLVSDRYLYTVFTDNPDNSQLAVDTRPSPSKTSGYVIAYRIDIEEGVSDYLPLFQREKIDNISVYQFSLSRLIGISDTSFAAELYIKKKQDMMFRIDFEERD